MFSYAMNNYWDTNYRAAQGGDFVFRYVVTSDRGLDPEGLTRLGWASLRPVELDYVVGQDKVGNPERPLPAEGTSFLEVDHSNVVLANWKNAEDGEGVILRLVEIGGHETTASLRFPRWAVKSAQLCNGVEDNLRPLSPAANSLNLSFHPYEVVTVRIQ